MTKKCSKNCCRKVAKIAVSRSEYYQDLKFFLQDYLSDILFIFTMGFLINFINLPFFALDIFEKNWFRFYSGIDTFIYIVAGLAILRALILLGSIFFYHRRYIVKM